MGIGIALESAKLNEITRGFQEKVKPNGAQTINEERKKETKHTTG